MAKLSPYLFFGTTAAQAMQFYKEIFGGDLVIMKAGESPAKDQFSPDMYNLTLHAMLTAPGITIMASDLMDGSTEKDGNRVDLCLEFNNKEEFETVWNKLSEGSEIHMPLKEEFFGTLGGLKDKFGILWMLQYTSPDKENQSQ